MPRIANGPGGLDVDHARDDTGRCLPSLDVVARRADVPAEPCGGVETSPSCVEVGHEGPW
jgi:hypothetical protein